ncbi:hypothetical protein F5984_24600 [Rudanella paleaurantiibacter]|uniref:Ig-like domain-containing protein n=1 Tax=Rudanella paleaurantiibacter TaxID=2614655 RepID=A0A7J5TSM7_9BACT|nr:hypothetical protein [Rudanella paleaurantiibacter]KAB7726499.1 hypothetical protein F5984_24600 [Rudanella paleaurantiibacter]
MKRLLHFTVCWLLLTTAGFAQSSLYGNMEVHPGGKVGVYNSMTFNSGYISTPRQAPPSNVAWAPASAPAGAANGSHVNGYAETWGNTAFTFPIGNGTTLRPAGISAPGSGTFSAAYFGTNPGAATLPTGGPFSTASLGTGVTGVSPVEYWDINGPSAVNLTLSWDANSNLNTLTGGTLSSLVIVGWDGTNWVNLGGTATGTLSGTGTITTTTPVIPNTYTAYTFGSVSTVTCATPTVAGAVSYPGGQVLCASSNAGSLTLTGQTGTVTGWETSTDGGTTWQAITGTAGNAFYTFINAQNGQQYRAIVSNGAGCQSLSATAVSIATSSTACTATGCDRPAGTVAINTTSEATGSNLVNQVILTDASGVIQYVSPAGSGTLSNVAAGSYLVYQVTFDNTQTPLPTLTPGTSLTAMGVGVCIKFSNQLTLNVCAPPTVRISGPAPGAVVTTTTPPITGTATPGTSVTLTGPGGQQCVATAANDGSYTCTSLTFTAGPQTVTAVVCTSVGCASATTNFSVNACSNPTVAGTASFTGGTLCSVANGGTITLSGQTGNVVRWETSTDGGTSFTPIANTTTSLAFTNAQNGQQYRAVVQNGAGCTAAASAPVTLTTSAGACPVNCTVQASVITK